MTSQMIVGIIHHQMLGYLGTMKKFELKKITKKLPKKKKSREKRIKEFKGNGGLMNQIYCSPHPDESERAAQDRGRFPTEQSSPE